MGIWVIFIIILKKVDWLKECLDDCIIHPAYYPCSLPMCSGTSDILSWVCRAVPRCASSIILSSHQTPHTLTQPRGSVTPDIICPQNMHSQSRPQTILSNTIQHHPTPGYNWGEHYQRHLSHNLDAWILFEKPTWSEEFDNSVLHNLILKDLCKRHTAHSIQIYLKTRNLYILVSLDVTIWVEMKWSMTLYVAFHSLYKERDSKC